MAVARVQQQEMVPLSPRSANIQFKAKAASQKGEKGMADEEAKKAEVARKAAKEKEYASPPPEWVIQPPLSRGGLAEKFRTGRLLGKGGFAIAYEGEWRSKKGAAEKTVFALKIVRAKMSQRKMEEKFRTELQIHAKMRHPNIVEFHRAFTFRESTYVVLEMCSNGSVMDMVRKRKSLTLPEVRRLTVQLCGAIKYMHARNVIHRDLKMGNLFLDQEMNLKIGDFGLAAVLVSKDEYEGIYNHAKSRRTTLCGTPNYIAPEILEKEKGGHDHKVDIWAIGVILFAMLAGQPPFQSASQNEIYRRARSVDYVWPQESKHSNDIPEEAKDLVTRLLKVDAEERPDPDQIVGHSFFIMRGGDAIPAKMEEYFRFETPHYLDQKARPRGDVMLKGTERLSLRALAKQCGVGHLPGDAKPQAAVGADMDISLYKECAAEEAAGTSPSVPLPNDMVYASKYSSMTWPSPQTPDRTHMAPEDADIQVPGTVISRTNVQRAVQMDIIERARRPVQSHAATLRAAHSSNKTTQGTVDPRLLAMDRNKGDPKERLRASVRGRRGLFNEQPLRATCNSAAPGDRAGGALERRTRATRSAKVMLPDDADPAAPAAATVQKPLINEQNVHSTSPDPIKKRQDMAARSRARIVSNVQKEMKQEVSESGSDRKILSIPVPVRPSGGASQAANALIGPEEVLEYLGRTKPDDVLSSLGQLHKQLQTSLDNTGRCRQRQQYAQEIESKTKAFKHRPVVVKWVDYTNKFGIGYILANGTVGCVFKGDGNNFPACVVVADAEPHLKKRKAPEYADKHQIVPCRGPPVEFIENCGDEGLKRVLVQASQYQIKLSPCGNPERLAPGADAFDFEKRKKLCLWDKFGKYMTQTLGKSVDDAVPNPPSEESSANTSRSRHTHNNAGAGSFVKFYQRLGNVGVWGFGDNSFQFNFPDHTKLVISADGTWLDFYHLPVSAAKALRSGERLGPDDLAERSVLCYPTEILLRAKYEGHGFEDVVKENELRPKMDFVRDVVGTWVKEGGLGRMGRKKGMMWEGMKEPGGKAVWVSVGARGGDARYEMPPAKS
ncbi:MAG: hypothetical protein Q9163_001986 [Psora crenata]